MKTKNLIFVFCSILTLLFSTAAMAASGWFTAGGEPLAWAGPTLSYHPEAGACGPYTNGEALTQLETYVALWDTSDFVGLTLNMVTGTVPAVNSANYDSFSSGDAAQDDTHPVFFDDDGEIIDSVFGEDSYLTTLGFAGPGATNTVTGEIVDGEMVMNCRCFEGHPSGVCSGSDGDFSFNEISFLSTLTHEFGHLLGMDHSQVNHAAVLTADTADNEDVPLMYPNDFTMTEVNLSTDDLISMAQVYPTTAFTSQKCLVTGTLLDSSGNPLRCADVQAVSDDPADTVAFVSGAAAVASDANNDDDSVDDGECESGCGDFALYLTPGTDYTIRVEPIDESFTGGSSVGPCSNEQLTTITSEQIATVTGSSCVGGATLALGNLTTNSTGGTEESGTSGTSSNESASACSLNTQPGSNSMPLSEIIVALVFFGFFIQKTRHHVREKKFSE